MVCHAHGVGAGTYVFGDGARAEAQHGLQIVHHHHIVVAGAAGLGIARVFQAADRIFLPVDIVGTVAPFPQARLRPRRGQAMRGTEGEKGAPRAEACAPPALSGEPGWGLGIC